MPNESNQLRNDTIKNSIEIINCFLLLGNAYQASHHCRPLVLFRRKHFITLIFNFECQPSFVTKHQKRGNKSCIERSHQRKKNECLPCL